MLFHFRLFTGASLRLLKAKYLNKSLVYFGLFLWIIIGKPFITFFMNHTLLVSFSQTDLEACSSLYYEIKHSRHGSRYFGKPTMVLIPRFQYLSFDFDCNLRCLEELENRSIMYSRKTFTPFAMSSVIPPHKRDSLDVSVDFTAGFIIISINITSNYQFTLFGTVITSVCNHLENQSHEQSITELVVRDPYCPGELCMPWLCIALVSTWVLVYSEYDSLFLTH